jgi:lipopolysaccharide export LptBFGC system permease protein LptF
MEGIPGLSRFQMMLMIMMMMMMIMMIIIGLFGQLRMWARSSGVRDVFTSTSYVFT